MQMVLRQASNATHQNQRLVSKAKVKDMTHNLVSDTSKSFGDSKWRTESTFHHVNGLKSSKKKKENSFLGRCMKKLF